MKSPHNVLPHLLAREALNCSNIISNTKQPNQDKFKSQTLDLSVGKGILVTNITDFSDLQHHDRGIGLSVILSRLFNTSIASQSRNDLSLATKKVVTYELDNSDSIFATLCTDTAFQQWFEKKVKKKDLFFVVGLQTIADAVFGLDSESVRAAAAGTVLPTQQSGLDVEVNASVHSERARDAQFKATEEQIYAVQYRKVEFSLLGPKELQAAGLSTKQFWKTYLTTRGKDGDEQFTAVRLAEGGSDTDLGCEVVSSIDGVDVIVHKDILATWHQDGTSEQKSVRTRAMRKTTDGSD